jgi:hypothetical protein
VIDQRTPVRERQSYRHEAYLWESPADFTAAMVAFVEEGLESGEPVMVAVTPEHIRWLQDGLSQRAADQVEFVDMTQLGRNPARIIPAWREFVTGQAGPGRPVRGIGEPIWPGRHPQELLECQLHEALLNVAIDPDTPLWLICPYDASALGQEVVEEAHRSHPVIVEAGSHRGSAHYAGLGHVDALFRQGLSTPLGSPRQAVYTQETIHRSAAYVKLELYIAGLPVERAAQLAAATRLLAEASLHRGSPDVAIRMWSDADAVTCEVTDNAPVMDLLYGRQVPTDEHEGLWQANQACDLVQLRSTSTTTTVRIFSWK